MFGGLVVEEFFGEVEVEAAVEVEDFSLDVASVHVGDGEGYVVTIGVDPGHGYHSFRGGFAFRDFTRTATLGVWNPRERPWQCQVY